MLWGVTAYFDHEEAELYRDREITARHGEGDERGAAWWRSKNVPHDELFVFYGGVPHPCQVPFKCPDFPGRVGANWAYVSPAEWRVVGHVV